MKTMSLWIFGLLFISLPGAHGQFPENFVLAKGNDANHNVTLTCDTKMDGAVTWRFNGGVVESDTFDDKIHQEGQNLIMSDISMFGEYSCWKGEQMLSNVSLLRAEEEDELDSPILCRAKSYDCNFTCTWAHNERSALRIGLGENCKDGEKTCHWVSSSTKLSDGRFQFELSHSLSPYTEESTMLVVTAEAITGFDILRKTKRFYLRDIVQPDIPQIVSCENVGQHLNVTIEPPSSWSTPHSFFSLEHQIEYVLRDDGQIRYSLSSLIPKRISKLRARSRDSLVLSTWSEWTPWNNGTC